MFNLEEKIKYVVIGDPVAHSLSPEMQNPGFEALGLGKCYGKLHVSAETFPEFVEFAREKLNGFNITVPHKQRIIPYLDSISREAELTGSVNTVIIKSGRMHGESTDGFGLENALREAFDFDLNGGKILFIGCGGAVQATAFHFAAQGAKALYFANRTLSKAEALSLKISENYPDCECCNCALNDEESLKIFIEQASVVVQGSSLGLKDSDPMPINPALLRDICFYDTIYRETPLLIAAGQAGLKTADGRTMLLHQGAKSLELWTGQKAPVKKMRQALYEAIEKGRK
ncbi:MAG: shikimate dehydrogenase [Victivallaceae bacterium]|nr:shikimate dehydrogenase [Victivallaceae bacterium]